MTQASWDPGQYLRHEGHRSRPFQDLLHRVPRLPGPAPRIADLGCGAGNVTALLAERWPAARITGFDTSADMLHAARRYAGPTAGGGAIDFREGDAARWLPDEPYDLVVSNAALQWVPNHREMIPRWIDGLAPGGVLAFQVPGQAGARSHVLLGELCDGAEWADRLGGLGLRRSGVSDPAGYLDLLAGPGRRVDAWETTYAQLLTGDNPVLDWVKGSALRPVLTALAADPAAADRFLARYAAALREAYPPGPHGTVYPFRRVFAVVATDQEK
ncbi:trans-aconitate 2-methyltransferase [Streptomyces sp. SL13]|uniref:Trans-aconitate 2-methyltransferase n=1 Tax=Streptantibioticus silvisoli TaxID=2705255 RepID=A0AA90KAM3_9ACTN|nr:trans-aconitate 2-methyltransferase [Streptantibioticus silvisoli]MDI5965577.1 trans-aconitate 2-methyltransferase [Streptantibioticus silvisoli]MDI5972598.1 trans-aconitate 2-methyltransferase [Streptantibioticus silvisoli]